MDQLYFLTGMTSDEVWDQANGLVDEMPSDLIREHKKGLTELFTIHAKTLKGEIARRAPDATFMIGALDIILEKIKQGELREALRDLAVGVIAHLPQRGSMGLDPRFEGMIGTTTDKNLALYYSVQRHGIGIMPVTALFVTAAADEYEPATFYKENLAKIFPNPEQLTIALT